MKTLNKKEMEQKRGSKFSIPKFVNNKYFLLFVTIVLFSLIAVYAGDVIVQEGAVTLKEVLNVEATPFFGVGINITAPSGTGIRIRQAITPLDFSNDGSTTTTIFSTWASFVGPQMQFRRGRGTETAPSTLSSTGDDIMTLIGYGQYDSTVDHIGFGGQILLETSQSWNATQRGTQMFFSTVEKGSTAGTTSMSIIDGDVEIDRQDLRLEFDNQKILLGTADDAEMYYDGTDLIINPDAVGSGSVKIDAVLRLVPRSSAPTASEGKLYVDSDSHALCYYNSTDWIDITRNGGACA